MSADVLRIKTELLQAVTEAMTELVRSGDTRPASGRVLRAALQQTESAYGFAGVMDGPTLRILNHEGVAWHDTVNRAFYDRAIEQYEQLGYLEFTRFDNLFGRVVVTGRPVISNAPADDPRAGGLPPGHPPLLTFLGVPILNGDRILGLLCVANRPGGYGPDEQHRLEVLAQMAAVVYDTRRRHQRETELQDHLRRAQKMQAVGRLAGGIAHDFNNILTAIGGYSDLLLEQVGDEHALSADLREIGRAAESAATLTRRLLTFSRGQALRGGAADLNAAVRDMKTLLGRTLGEDIRIETHLTPGLAAVPVDATSLQQVLMNLAVNARDAMPGGGTLTIETRRDEVTAGHASAPPGLTTGGYVRLTVSDTGCGMDAATREQVFEPFFTTKTHGRGHGLGLPTVYGIVTQAGGTVCVYSEVGCGTTFTLYLPETLSRVEPAPPGPRAAPASLDGSETVLVVEDDDAVRTFAARVLRRHGYVVHEAGTPDAALGLGAVVHDSVDLVLTDLVMPGMNGSELAGRLRAGRPRLRTLFMSGYTGQTIRRRGLSIDPRELLEKPFTSAQLLQKLREALDAGTRDA